MLLCKCVVALMAVLLTVSSPVQAQGNASIEASGAWIRVLPPVQKTTGAYVTLTNKGLQDRALVSASSPSAREVQLHEMSHANGMMTMRQVERIAIPQGAKAELKPGGYHLMFFDLVQPLKEKDEVPVELVFDDGSVLSLKFPAMLEEGQKQKACH